MSTLTEIKTRIQSVGIAIEYLAINKKIGVNNGECNN